MEYIEFLKNKMAISHNTGFEIKDEDLTPYLYPHVKDTVKWAVKGGCRAIFSSFGMQKTVTQLEILRVVLKHKGRKGLSTELSYDYWKDGLAYLREAEMEVSSPTLFDLMDAV